MTMRGIGLRCAALGFLVGTSACSLLLSTSDLTEEEPVDGGGPSSFVDAGAADAPIDGAVVDAVAEASSATFCQTLSPAPKFCADFDGTGAVDEGWAQTLIDPPGVGSVTRDPLGRDRSSVLVQHSAPQSCSYTRMTKTFATSGKGMRIAFSFRPSSPWTNDAVFAFANLEGTQGGCGILLHLEGPNGANLHFQYGSPQQDDIFPWSIVPKADVWSSIEAAIAASGELTVSVDGAPAITRPLPLGCAAGGEVYFALGFHCEGTAHEARYDDVVVDYP